MDTKEQENRLKQKAEAAPKSTPIENHKKNIQALCKQNAVAEQCLWNVYHVSGKPAEKKEQRNDMDRNISGVSVKDYETLKNFEDKSPPQAENASSSKKVSKRILIFLFNLYYFQDEPISVECTDETSSRLSPATDISHEMAEHGTPDSGMISDVSEIKVLPAGKIEKKLIKELNPEMMVGRDGRRYRQKLREAEKQATVEFKLENFEQTNGEAQSVENDILTGKEKRRLKDKLRKEKKEQSKLFVEKDLEKNKVTYV